MLRLVERSKLLPVTLAEFSQHLRRDGSTDDELVRRNLKAAVTWAENFTGMALIDQTWDFYFDAFPNDAMKSLYIPRPPLIEILGVFARDGSEIEFTGYLLDYASTKEKARIYLGQTGSWPGTDGQPNAGRIRFRAGFIDTGDSPAASGEVPEDIKAAICIYGATLYENREIDSPGRMASWGAENLLREYRVVDSMA